MSELLSELQKLHSEHKARLARFAAAAHKPAPAAPLKCKALAAPVDRPPTYPEWFWQNAYMRPQLKMSDIHAAVSRHMDVPMADILSQRRRRVAVVARMASVYLARTLTIFSLPHIARYTGNRDHSTILHSERRALELIDTDPSFAEAVEAIRSELEENFDVVTDQYCTGSQPHGSRSYRQPHIHTD